MPGKRGNPNWKKGGPSPNPAGGPKVVVEFKLSARRIVDEYVLKAWQEELVSRGPDWVKCSELLAAYGYGKPSSSMDITTSQASGPVLPVSEMLDYLQRLESHGKAADTPGAATLTLAPETSGAKAPNDGHGSDGR